MNTRPPSLTIPAGGDAMRNALAAAPVGATLRLAAGDHVGPFVLLQDVTLQSRDPANPAVLRGCGEGALVAVDGRGVSITMRDLQIADGGDTNSGALIRVANGALLLLERLLLRHGVATGYGGGALYLRRGEATLRACRLEGNHGRSGGALLVSNDATLLAEHCVFVDNVAAHSGAVLAARDRATIVLRGCDLREQTAPTALDPEVGWLVDAHFANGAKAVTLDGCQLQAAREGAVRLR